MAFDSQQFAFRDIRVVLLGREVVGFQGVKYKVKQEKEFLYGRGSKPLAVQSGNESVEGSLTFLQSELEALVAAVKTIDPTKKLTQVSFDVVVTYGNSTDASTDILLGCQITEYEKGMAQGDKYMKIELPFMALDVKENA